MHSATLSAGAVKCMYQQDTPDPVATTPVLQVLSVKKVPVSSGPDRYRLILSDGQHFMQGMVVTQLNHLITQDDGIDKNAIIRLDQYACNAVQGRLIIICLALELLEHTTEKIGNPVSVDTAVSAPAPQVAAPPSNNENIAPAKRPGSNASSTVAAKKPAMNSNRSMGAAKNTGTSAPIYPIDSLSPYQNKWTIKARVTSKSDIRHWSNARGDGKLFSVNLLDESGEIKATGFNEQVDLLYPLLEEGKVYYISKARVNIAKKQFSNLSNEYEIAFEKTSEVELADDQDGTPQINYNFVTLGNLANVDKDTIVDILGIVKDVGAMSEITTKATSKQIKKREITIVDTSAFSCRLTLWGRQAETWSDNVGGLYAFKGAKVGDFGGRTLSLISSSTVTQDPDIDEAHSLRGWYDSGGSSAEHQSFSNGMSMSSGPATFKKENFRHLGEAREQQLGAGDKVDTFDTRATVMNLKKDSLSYPACPTKGCNKKVTLMGDGWKCEKCDQVYPEPDYRYIIRFPVSDHTDSMWFSGFNDVGETILGVDANEMNRLKDEDEPAFDEHIRKALGKTYNFQMRAKSEHYNDDVTIKYQVNKIAYVNWSDAASLLVERINLYG